MTNKEKRLFHKNWKYMWSKLSTTYYDVKHPYTSRFEGIDAETSIPLQYDEKKLPAYSVCSRINSDKTYEPSMHTVNKVVAFYNLYINPPVTSFQFLNEDLGMSDNSRYLNPTDTDGRFVGQYWGYYLVGEKMLGAYLSIYEINRRLRATLVTGVRDNEELMGGALKKVFDQKQPQHKDFMEYFSSRRTEDKRCYFYEGDVELTRSSMIILFRTPDITRRKIVLSLNLDCFTEDREKYWGGLALIMETSDGKENAKAYFMGLISTDACRVPLESAEVRHLLEMTANNQVVELTSGRDSRWYEFIFATMDSKKNQTSSV